MNNVFWISFILFNSWILNSIGFIKNINIIKNKNKIFMKSCFIEPNDNDNNNNNNRKKSDNNFIYTNKDVYEDSDFDNEKPLYTLIWYDCKKCMQLLEDMDKLNLKKLYINGSYYFYDVTNIDGFFDDPVLYKDDEFIGDNLFDIYEEIYGNN